MISSIMDGIKNVILLKLISFLRIYYVCTYKSLAFNREKAKYEFFFDWKLEAASISTNWIRFFFSSIQQLSWMYINMQTHNKIWIE